MTTLATRRPGPAPGLVALNLYSDLVDPWDASRLMVADAYAQQMARAIVRRRG